MGFWAPHLPYPVNVNMPPVATPDTRTQIRTTGPQLDIAIPQDKSRHEKLGQFIEAWGALESTLTFLFMRLASVELSDAALIFPKFGTKNALDLLESLGQRKLIKDSSSSLINLIDRARKLNGKRNILIHGHWVLEANVLTKRGEVCLAVQFLREVIPSDPDHEKLMGNPRNQKERVRYSFTLKRIDASARDSDGLPT
jgi:hypothetical protein